MTESSNEVQKVVGLQYEVGEGVPKVVLKGSGRLADEVIERRKLSSLPIVQDEKLAKELYKLPVDAEIGEDLFELVAALLVHIYAAEEKFKRNMA